MQFPPVAVVMTLHRNMHEVIDSGDENENLKFKSLFTSTSIGTLDGSPHGIYNGGLNCEIKDGIPYHDGEDISNEYTIYAVSDLYEDTFKSNAPEEEKWRAVNYDHKVNTVVNSCIEDYFLPFLYLLNTRGVSVETREPPAKINRKRIDKGKRPFVPYKVLKFELPKTRLQAGRVYTGTGERRKLHTCMGTRFYSAENPLFGHYVGPVWVHPHLRGSAKEGVVMKDYQLAEAA